VRKIFVIVFLSIQKLKAQNRFIIQLLHFCAELCARKILAEFFWREKKLRKYKQKGR